MAELADLEQRLGLPFHDKRLLQQAMVHRSFLNENPSSPLSSNERLEFLGDAVLGFVVAEELYRRFPDLPEGRLTRLRSAIVCKDGLCKIAQRLGLGEFLILGRGEHASSGRNKPSNLARALEALIGAAYLDQSFEGARQFILSLLSKEINEQAKCVPCDFKSALQERLHADRRGTPAYRTVDSAGPDHEKVFTVEVSEGGAVLAMGAGRSKKTAEAAAARAALEKMDQS
ncbi:MAG: ribonuclease III [Chloroflexi bacterium]|nr:ribonuclease III [Chloroflexota bacterium]